jgi:hypothetical protein
MALHLEVSGSSLVHNDTLEMRWLRLVNNSVITEERVRQVAQLSGVQQCNFVVVLDSAVNSLRADSAKLKLTEYRSKGWTPLPSWAAGSTGESDIHACTVCRSMIDNQQLPQHAKDTIIGSDLLVYIDGTWTAGDAIDFVLTFAHELRHAWQFYNVPIVFFSRTPLAWVMQAQSTPSEVDAEKNGKAVAERVFGPEAVSAHLAAQIASCRPEHRDMLVRLKDCDTHSRSREGLEWETLQLLQEPAVEIRRLQFQNSCEIPGIRELIMHAEGKLQVKLLP